jgi:hypothetical protein
MRYDFTYVQAAHTRTWHERAEALLASLLSLVRRTR